MLPNKRARDKFTARVKCIMFAVSVARAVTPRHACVQLPTGRGIKNYKRAGFTMKRACGMVCHTMFNTFVSICKNMWTLSSQAARVQHPQEQHIP